MLRRVFLVLSSALALTSCFQSQVSLDYHAHPASQRERGPSFDVGAVMDQRQVEAPAYLGYIKGSRRGLPEELYMTLPADETVRNAFLHGMSARGMQARGRARVRLEVQVQELFCRFEDRPYARCTLDVTALSSGGRVLYRQSYSAARQDAGYLFDYNDRTEDLREIASRTLQDAVDKALDDPRLE
jgi:hypothetical protein